MRVKNDQTSFWDTYSDVAANLEYDKPKILRLLDEHIDWDEIIPARAFATFYQKTGRPRNYPLVGFIKCLILQKICGYIDDSLLLLTLRYSPDLRLFCDFKKVPDASKLTRFKQDFLPYLNELFEQLVPARKNAGDNTDIKACRHRHSLPPQAVLSPRQRPLALSATPKCHSGLRTFKSA